MVVLGEGRGEEGKGRIEGKRRGKYVGGKGKGEVCIGEAGEIILYK